MPTHSLFRRKWMLRHEPHGRQGAVWGMAIGLPVALLTLLLVAHHPLGASLEYDTLDFWFTLRDPQPPREVVILAVDGATVHRWQGRAFDADEIGKLLVLLRRSGARAAALTFYNLTERVSPQTRQAALVRALAQSRIAHLPLNFEGPELDEVPTNRKAGRALRKFAIYNSFLADSEPRPHTQRVLQAPNADLLQASAGVGHLTFTLDSKGRPHTLPLVLVYENLWYPALALSTMMQAIGTTPADLMPQDAGGRGTRLENSEMLAVGPQRVPMFEGDLLLNYPDGARDIQPDQSQPVSLFPIISVAEALSNPAVLSGVRGKVVVLGPTAPGLASLFPTPTGRRVPAVELHAIALDNLLTGRALVRAPGLWMWLFTVLTCLVVGGFTVARPPLWSALISVLALMAVTAISLSLFERNIWFNISTPWLSSGITFLISVVARTRRQEHDNTRIASTIDALTQVSEIITAQTQPHELLDRVLHWTTSVMHAAGASAYLLDPHGQVLRRAATTLPRAQESPPPALEVGEGVAGWVAEHGQPAIINDVLEDWRCSYGAETGAPDFMATAILCVPLRMRDKMLGVVEVIDPVDGSPFTPADAELLTAVANQAAVVLENAQLYEILNQRVVQSESELAVTNRRLESERNLLETVLQSMTDGVVVTDLAQRVQLINPAAAALLPELSESARGRLLQQVLPEFRGSSPSHAEPALLKRGDRATPRLIEAHRAPLRAGDGVPEGVIIVFADVTEKRGIEQAKSDFVSFVAHEMRSPLTSIAGFSALLRRHGETADKPLPGAARERYLTIIHDESERLTRLINNLLDVARIEAGRAINLQRETLDFAAVAMNAADAQRGYSDNHEIVCNLPPDLPPVVADRDKVKQILINLLSNALKYSPRGTVTIAARVNGQFMEVSISDEGPGIPAEQREQLFERFSDTATTQRVTSSTGLGLFLTKHLVEAHGGHIWVESVEGQGSTFFFTLPLESGGE